MSKKRPWIQAIDLKAALRVTLVSYSWTDSVNDARCLWWASVAFNLYTFLHDHGPGSLYWSLVLSTSRPAKEINTLRWSRPMLASPSNSICCASAGSQLIVFCKVILLQPQNCTSDQIAYCLWWLIAPLQQHFLKFESKRSSQRWVN